MPSSGVSAGLPRVACMKLRSNGRWTSGQEADAPA